MTALDMGACELLIVYENLEISRYVIRNLHTDKQVVHFLTPIQEKDENTSRSETNVELEVVDKTLITEWLVKTTSRSGPSWSSSLTRVRRARSSSAGSEGSGGSSGTR